MKTLLGMVCFWASLAPFQARAVERFSFPKPKDMTLAEVVMVETVRNPKAVLVLCPGFNGNGEGMIVQKEWQDFARQQQLGLVGIHFQSPGELLKENQGYYQAKNGSGDVLLEAVKKIYGKDLPILIFGFSGGAHFTTRLIEWKPERILGWCALGAGVLDVPQRKGEYSRGIMACGEDDPRLGGALTFFKQGRAMGRPWIFASVSKVGHSMSPKLNAFAREYFAVILAADFTKGLWVDIDRKETISNEQAIAAPSVSGWLPDKSLLPDWKALNEL